MRRGFRRRLTWTLLLVCALVVAAPPAASAHAVPERTDPQDGAILVDSPHRIRVVFDDPVEVGPRNEVIRNGGGSVVDGTPVARGKVLVIPVRPELRTGDYSVRWSIVSDDGHEEEGVLAFAVGTTAPPASTLTVRDSLSVGTAILRWVFFAGVLLAGGLALFELLVWRPVADESLPAEAFAVAFLAAVVSGLLLIAQTGTGLSTRFGVVVAGAVAISVLGAVAAACALRLELLRPALPVLALSLLLAPPLAGHAFESRGSRAEALIDLGHTVGSAFWLGALAALAVVLPIVRARPGLPIAAAKRFSRVAVLTVALIAVTGLGNALVELSSVSQLWTTSYGRLLVLKTLLFALLLELGWISRRRLASGFEGVRRAVSSELAVFLALVLVVGVLTALPPGKARLVPLAAANTATLGLERLPPRDAVVLGKRDGAFAAAIAIRPSGEAIATFIGSDVRQVDVGPVTIDGRPTRRCGTGCYAGRAGSGPVVTVRHRKSTLRFVRAPARPAAALLARTNRAYGRLRTVAFTQRIASGLGTKVLSHWVETRTGFSYRVENGNEAISIGTRRWDRAPDKPWKASPAVPSGGELVPPWGNTGRLTNAHVVGGTASTHLISFLGADTSYPAWFTVEVDKRTLRPLRVRMTAAAHFMRTHYDFWNRPVTLHPPRG